MASQWSIKESYTLGIGQTYHLTEKGLTIGRDTNSDIVVYSKSVDLDHARIEWDKNRQQFCIRDLNSVNGTYINQFPLRGTSKLLEQRDSIRFGYCTEQVFRVDFSVTPTVSTTSTQTNLGREGPPILTTTVQYVPSVIVPCTSSDSSGTTITQTVIPQVISVVSLPETSSVVTTVPLESQSIDNNRKNSQNLGSPLYGCPSWWGEEDNEKEKAGSDSEIKDKESFRPRSAHLLSPIATRMRHKSLSNETIQQQHNEVDPLEQRASSVDRELTNTTFTIEFDTPKRTKPNISRSSSLRLRSTSTTTGSSDNLKEPPRQSSASLTPPTTPQHKSIKKRPASVYGQSSLTEKTPPTSETSTSQALSTSPHHKTVKKRSSSVHEKSSLTEKTPLPSDTQAPPTSSQHKSVNKRPSSVYGKSSLADKTPPSSLRSDTSRPSTTRNVRSGTVVMKKDEKGKEEKRGEGKTAAVIKSRLEIRNTTRVGKMNKRDESGTKKRMSTVTKKKSEESPLPSPSSNRDATYIVNDSDDKLDETTLIFTPTQSTTTTSPTTATGDITAGAAGDDTTCSTPSDGRLTSNRKQWNDKEVPHGLILSSIEARLKRLAEAASNTATSVQEFIEQSKEGSGRPLSNDDNGSLTSEMDLPQWRIVSKEYQSICQYITASEESLKAIHRSIGQFIATADEDIYLKESEAESGVIIQSDSLDDSTGDSNNSSSNPILLVSSTTCSEESPQREELNKTGSELYYSISSETEDN